MTVSADELLRAVAAFGVTGIAMPDPRDPSTWTLAPASLTVDQVAAAMAALRAVVEPTAATPQITKIAFLRLLQPMEWAAFAKGAETDPMLLYGKALLDAALYLTPTEPTFLQMLAYCVAVGLFTQARADAIVAGMV